MVLVLSCRYSSDDQLDHIDQGHYNIHLKPDKKIDGPFKKTFTYKIVEQMAGGFKITLKTAAALHFSQVNDSLVLSDRNHSTIFTLTEWVYEKDGEKYNNCFVIRYSE